MAKENQNLKTFTPSVDEGLLDISPQMTVDALQGLFNPFSKQNMFRKPARESEIRDNLKSNHVSEFADFLLKGGARGFDRDDLDKTYKETDNPLIKETIMRGDTFVTSGIIRNNFYGLELDDRNLIAQAHVINARFNPLSSLGKFKEGETPKEVLAEFNNLKTAKNKFETGDINRREYDVIKGRASRNLTENINKAASRNLFTDPRSKEGLFLADPYGGKPKSRQAAIEAGIGPFEQGIGSLRAYGVSPLEELQLLSQYGFSPEVPSHLGSRTGTDYVPTKNQERYRVIPQRSREGFEGFEPERKIDRLKDFISMEDSNMLYGPEGVYYNPETEQFLRGEPTYGEPPTLQGYKYDPRLIELMRMQKGSDYAEQFKKIGGAVEERSPYQNKGEVEVEEEGSDSFNLLDKLRRWWDIRRHFENMPEEVDYSQIIGEESEETKMDRAKDEEIKKYLESIYKETARQPMNRGGLSGQAQDVANAGRYGDTMLMHVNPAEVQGLKSLGMPITTNPQTGQPEAFLPLLGALLGGSGMFAGVAPWLTGALGSGILSGAGSLLQGDSLKEAALTGLGSFAGSKLLGNLGATSEAGVEAGVTGAGDAVGEVVASGVDKGLIDVSNIGADTMAKYQNLIDAPGSIANLEGQIGNMAKDFNIDKGVLEGAIKSGAQAGTDAFASVGIGGSGGPNLGDVKEGFSFKNLYGAATRPDVFLPGAIGGGGLAMIKSQEDFERLMAQYEEDRKGRRAKTYADNPEQVPYGSQWGRILGVPPRPVSSGGRMGFFGGGLGSLGSIPQPLGGYTMPYADRPAINMPPYNENLVMGRG